MTINDLIKLANGHLLALLIFFVAPPVIAWLCGLIHGRGNGGNAPWKYIYSVLVYAVCIPGLFASVLTAYELFFQRGDLLNVNLAIYFLPIVSMVVTLIFIHKTVNFENVPGFDRISGLMVMIGCSFLIALVVDKTRILFSFTGRLRYCLRWRREFSRSSNGAPTCCSSVMTSRNRQRLNFRECDD